jgi:hypothetical protein
MLYYSMSSHEEANTRGHVTHLIRHVHCHVASAGMCARVCTCDGASDIACPSVTVRVVVDPPLVVSSASDPALTDPARIEGDGGDSVPCRCRSLSRCQGATRLQGATAGLYLAQTSTRQEGGHHVPARGGEDISENA